MVRTTGQLDHLSASTAGKGVLSTATSSPGTLVHQVPDGETHLVTLSFINIGSAKRTVVVQWGGTASSDAISFDIDPTPSGLHTEINGQILEGDGAAADIRVYESNGSEIVVFGQVVKLTEQ